MASDALRKEVKAAMRRAAMEFESANIKNDGVLDAQQFSAMMRARIGNPDLSDEQLAEWFNSLTRDNDQLSLDEFFCFCMFDIAEEIGGVAVVFETYDADDSGLLSTKEFSKAIEEMGFGPATEQLLEQFDCDRSGFLSYGEIIQSVRDLYKDPAFKSLCQAITRDDEPAQSRVSLMSQKASKAARRKNPARLKTPEAVRRELEKLLKENAARVMDLFREMDQDASGVISEREFRRALTTLGFQGSADAVQKLFDELDSGGNYTLSFTEMNDWLHDGVEVAVDTSLTWDERAKLAADEDDDVPPEEASPKANMSRARPSSAGSKPVWRPVRNRPA